MQQRRGFEKNIPSQQEKYLVNEKINSSHVRVIGAEGEQLGILATEEAIKIAEEQGLDLVAVSPDSDPPVCRLLDYGKLKYREQKKAAEARKKTAVRVVKELQIRYRTDKHDIETKVRNARKFLEAGDRVRFQMRFRGREAVYEELGRDIFNDIGMQLTDIAIIEDQTPLMGQRMSMTLAPR